MSSTNKFYAFLRTILFQNCWQAMPGAEALDGLPKLADNVACTCMYIFAIAEV